MIALVQRVSRASVEVAEPSYTAAIEQGLLVLLGVEDGDDQKRALWTANKLARLRIFSDPAGKMNHSVQDVGGSILLISQFTLAGDCAKGNRPSFVRAAPPDLGRQLYEQVAETLRNAHNVPTETGIFGAKMRVSLVNEGPVTIIV